MPWSPVPKFPDIINTLKSMGYTKEVTIEPLRKAVMMHTGIIKDETIKQTIQAMETLDFLTPKRGGITSIWYIGKAPEKEKPKQKPIEDEISEIDDRLDAYSEKESD